MLIRPLSRTLRMRVTISEWCCSSSSPSHRRFIEAHRGNPLSVADLFPTKVWSLRCRSGLVSMEIKNLVPTFHFKIAPLSTPIYAIFSCFSDLSLICFVITVQFCWFLSSVQFSDTLFTDAYACAFEDSLALSNHCLDFTSTI